MNSNTPLRPISGKKSKGGNDSTPPNSLIKSRSLSPLKTPQSPVSPTNKIDIDASKRHKFINNGPMKLQDIFISSTDATDSNYIESPMQQKNVFAIRKEMKKKDILIVVEHCHDCEKHNSLSLRHDEKQYFSKAKNIIREIVRTIHACKINIRCGVVRIPVSSPNRLGACEVAILYKDNDNILHDEIVVHSKLASGLWPDTNQVIKQVVDFVNKKRIARYVKEAMEDEDEIQIDTEKKQCPDGFKDFEDIEIGNPLWLSTQDDFDQIEWVFESTQTHWNSDYLFEIREIFGDCDISDELVKITIPEENKGKDGRPSDIISYDEVYSYSVKAASLKHICGDMMKTVTKDKKVLGLISEISNIGDEFSLDGIYVEAIITPNNSDSSLAIIKFKIKFQSDYYAYDINNYGTKTISFGTPQGIVFNDYEIYLTPEIKNCAPKKFLFVNKLTNDLITEDFNVIFHCENKKDQYTNRSLFGEEEKISVKTSKGFLSLPIQIKEGIWSLEIFLDGFEKIKSKKFISYGDVSIDSEEIINLIPKLIVKRNDSSDPNEQLLFDIQKCSNINKNPPTEISLGQTYIFGISFKVFNELEDNEFKRGIAMEKKPIKIIMKAQNESKGLSNIVFQAVAVPYKKTGGAIIAFKPILDNSKYPNGKFNVTNYGIFKTLLFAGLDGYVFKIVNDITINPDDSVKAYPVYNFINSTQSKIINDKTVTVNLKKQTIDFAESTDAHLFQCNKGFFSVPNNLSDGLWIMECSIPGFGTSEVKFISINNQKRIEINFFDILFNEKLPINRIHDLPNKKLAETSENVISSGDIPVAASCDETVYQFKLNTNLLVCELKERMINKQISKVIVLLDGNVENNLIFDAVAIPININEFYMKFQIKVDEADDADAKYNINNYGQKCIQFVGPDGYVILKAVVDLLPDESIRPPSQYEFVEQVLSNKRLIDHTTVIIQFESIFSKYLPVKSFTTEKGILDVGTTIQDGGWLMTCEMADSFAVKRKFLKYGNRFSKKSVEEVQLVRKNTSIDLKQSNITIPPGALMVHPTSDEVYVDISLFTKTSITYFGTFRSDQFLQLVNFPNCPDRCEFKCTAFIIPGKMPNNVDKVDLQKGSYSNHDGAPNRGLKFSDVIVVKEFTVVKDHQSLVPNFVDTGADKVKFRIIHKDVPVKDKPVDCNFTPEGIKKSYPMEGRVTTSDGTLAAILPPGSIQISVVTATGAAISFQEPKPTREIITDVNKRTNEINVTRLFESTIIAMISDDHSESRPILLLGDVSGSMDEGDRMIVLKSTFKSMFENATKRLIDIGLVAWCNKADFCCPGNDNNNWESDGKVNKSIRYLKDSDNKSVLSWIENLKPNGGTNMKVGIEESMLQYKDAKDIYVICDGDVTPFSASSWESFINNYNKDIKFHFIALADDAQNAEMKQMSELGRGEYTAANKKN